MLQQNIFGKTILIIARKYNDIIYAISTKEFKNARQRILVIISQNLSFSSYPFQDFFDEVHFIKINGVSIIDQLLLVANIYKIRNKIKCNTLVLSNLVLLSHNYIAKISSCSNIILLEDGFMNYRSDNFDNNKLKDLALKFLHINKKNTFSKISKTYLLAPNLSTYFWGEPSKLNIDFKKCKVEGLNLDQKKIFVGQPLYANGLLSIEQYVKIVNRIITDYHIDYYLPHFCSSSKEIIDCNYLNLEKFKCTLEILAANNNFEIFSFASSILYTTKFINHNIKSNMIIIPETVKFSHSPVYSVANVNYIKY